MMVKPRWVHLLLIAGLVFAQSSPIDAAKPTDSKPDPGSTRSNVDEQLEQNVLRMVDQHLPEIKVLLEQLRRHEPKKYDAAIRNLAKSSRRLQLAEKRGQEALELEVQIVQAQSSINLLIAKLTVRDNPKDRLALKDATRRLHQAEVDRSRYELAQLQSRLERMQKLFETAQKRLIDKESSLDDQIEKGFQTYLRKSGRE